MIDLKGSFKVKNPFNLYALALMIVPAATLLTTLISNYTIRNELIPVSDE